MLQFFKHLNNGHDPMLILGRGALGYRPQRQMIGRRVQERYRPFRALFGRGLSDDEEEIGHGGGGGGPSEVVPYTNKKMFNEAQTLLKTINDEDEPVYIPPTIKENPEISEHFFKTEKILGKYENTNKLKTIIEAYHKSILESEGKDIKSKDDINREVYKSTIQNILPILNKINDYADPTIINNAVSLVNSCLIKLNKLYTLKQFEIKEGKLMEVTKEPKVKGEFPANLAITEAKNIIAEYWGYNKKDNQVVKDKIKNEKETILETDLIYPKEINKLIKKINKTKLLDDFYDEKAPIEIKCKEFRQLIPDETLSKEYMKTIVVNGKYVYRKDGKIDGAPLEELMNKNYKSSGKPYEYTICGLDNPLAKKIFKVENPNMQVTDYLVKDAGSKLGGQFCVDNVDIENKIFSEMKYYNDIHYFNQCNVNIQLQEIYIDKLKNDLIKNIELYIATTNKKDKEDYHYNIMALYNVLSDKTEFEKDFYLSRQYLGVGITMNKFNAIILPVDFDKLPEDEQKKIINILNSQGQKFTPIMKDRKITGIKMTVNGNKDKEIRKEFNEHFKGIIGTGPFKYVITCIMSNGIGVYDYSDDDLVINDYILGTYRSAYAHDDQDGNYNAVLVPVGKFKLTY